MLISAYAVLRTVHLVSVVTSGLFFLTRGVWMLTSPDRLQRGWVRITPHLIDTLLLASAVALVIITGQYPGATAWLNAKLAALVVYIVLGTIALRRGRTRSIRMAAFLAALAVFVYIVAVATTRNPWPLSV